MGGGGFSCGPAGRLRPGYEAFAAANDLTITPAYLPDLANEVLDLLIDGESGVWHLAPPEPVTWAGLAYFAAEHARLDASRIQGMPASSFAWPAPRPAYSALGTARGQCLPPLSDSVARFARDFAPAA